MEEKEIKIIPEILEKEIKIIPENIEVINANLEEITVVSSNEEQIITPSEENTYYNKVIVEPIITENIEVISSNEDKVITPTTGKFINEVLVKGDSNLIPENIKKDVSILSVIGTLDTMYKPSYISFYNFTGTNLDYELSNLNTSNMTKMDYMFYQCQKLQNLNIQNFNTQNVTSMTNMFYNCRLLEQLNLSNFDTSKVTNMSSMFQRCENLIELDISNFDTTNVTNNAYMFQYCEKLVKLVINNQNVFKMTNSNMFNNTPIASGTGYVYVPDNMVETYKSATNWSVYAEQIKSISELEA